MEEAESRQRRESAFQDLSWIVKLVVGQAIANLLVWIFVLWFLFTSVDQLKSWVLIDARNAVERMIEQAREQHEGENDGNTE